MLYFILIVYKKIYIFIFSKNNFIIKIDKKVFIFNKL